MFTRLKRLGKLTYFKLLRINDNPLKIALGFGLGVFVGVMPGIGPLVAVLLAFIFRVNRVSALIGSVLFNTWTSVITLVLAVKIGAVVRGVDFHHVDADWHGLIKNFKWERLLEASFYDVFIPVGIGYLIVSLVFAVAATVGVYMVLQHIRKKKPSTP